MARDRQEALWKDRKRIFGMPISFTRYEVGEGRLTIRKGFFRTETDEVLLYRILDMKLVRTFWQKILGVGSITIYCADKTESEFTLQSIARPESTRKLLGRAVEEERRARGIAGREMYGSSSEYMHHAMDGDLDGDGIAD